MLRGRETEIMFHSESMEVGNWVCKSDTNSFIVHQRLTTFHTHQICNTGSLDILCDAMAYFSHWTI